MRIFIEFNKWLAGAAGKRFTPFLPTGLNSPHSRFEQRPHRNFAY
jgi:hypothetical protein